MTDRIWVAGVAMTRFGVHADLSNHGLARWAVRDALEDAGAKPDDVGTAFYATATHGPIEGQFTISGQIALRGLGIQDIPVYNVENACATGSTALNLATMSIRAGETDIALAVGAEKMNVGDRKRILQMFDSGYDLSDPEALERTLEELGGTVAGGDTVGHRSIFMDIYAA